MTDYFVYKGKQPERIKVNVKIWLELQKQEILELANRKQKDIHYSVREI